MAKMERNLWKESEIRALLSIIDERKILNMISEKRYRNEQIFRYVESEMCARGFTKKNYLQIWTKWKFLKSSYVTTKRHNSFPGSIPRLCDYYYTLEKILNDNQQEDNDKPKITNVEGGVEIQVVKQEIMDEDETESLKFDEEPEASSTPSAALPPLRKIAEPGNRRKRSRVAAEIPEAHYPDIENTEESPNKKPIQGNYLRALKELATNLRQMQKELVADFFRKQEELIREEHEFQRQQDEILLKSFEEQTRLLLDSARNLLSTNASMGPEIVYINEED